VVATSGRSAKNPNSAGGDPVTRRSTPERIDEARRAATHNRLVGEGATEATADAWIAAWEAQAANGGWRAIARRIAIRRATHRDQVDFERFVPGDRLFR
jgi:hypothetical protein